MLKKVIDILKCKEGDILANEITNKYGVAVVVKDTIINEYMKQKLQDMGVNHISIYQQSIASHNYYDVRHENFSTLYYRNLRAIKQIIIDLAAGKGLDSIKIKELSDMLYEQITSDRNIASSLSMLRQYDEDTFSHSLNVSIYAALLGKWLGLSKGEIQDLVQAGILHDLGKTGISKDILNKKGRLLPDEYEIIKKHSVFSYNMIKDIDIISDQVKDAVLMHHERADGTGYPFGYGLNRLNLFSKAIAIVDVYDAIISSRAYKSRSTPFEAFEWFLGPGLAFFDISLVTAFFKNISCSYVGAKARLNTGAVGEIVYIPPHNISKPILRVHSSYIDLSKHADTRIVMLE